VLALLLQPARDRPSETDTPICGITTSIAVSVAMRLS
jgi:hypothetical protein